MNLSLSPRYLKYKPVCLLFEVGRMDKLVVKITGRHMRRGGGGVDCQALM